MDKELLEDRYSGKFINHKTGRIFHIKYFTKKRSVDDYQIEYDINKMKSDYDIYEENIKKVCQMFKSQNKLVEIPNNKLCIVKNSITKQIITFDKEQNNSKLMKHDVSSNTAMLFLLLGPPYSGKRTISDKIKISKGFQVIN